MTTTTATATKPARRAADHPVIRTNDRNGRWKCLFGGYTNRSFVRRLRLSAECQPPGDLLGAARFRTPRRPPGRPT
jgi:hypothetical protein